MSNGMVEIDKTPHLVQYDSMVFDSCTCSISGLHGWFFVRLINTVWNSRLGSGLDSLVTWAESYSSGSSSVKGRS